MEIISEEPGFKTVKLSDEEISLLSIILGYVSSEYDALDVTRLSFSGATEGAVEKLSDEIDRISGVGQP